MSSKILIERFRDSEKALNYIKESGVNELGKHYIGRLEGIAADFLNPTRNGRKYPLQLWKNVENSDDFKEGMATLTIFGEADHPEERLETSIKEVAVCLRKFEIREDEGIVWCSFDILDTPNGRIVKELLDYGSKLGVSSRGSGEEVTDANGETIIDPDTYLFICFDVVIMPAVATARPERTESKKVAAKATTLIESITKEINNAKSIQELNSIKSIIESQKIPGSDSLKESLNKQLSKLENGDDVSSKFIAELEKATSKINNLMRINESLKNKLSASDTRINEYKDLLTRMKSNSRNLKAINDDSHATIKTLREANASASIRYSKSLSRINDEMNEKIESLQSEIERLNLKLKESFSNSRRLKESNNKLSEQVEKLQKSNESKSEVIADLKNKSRLTENRYSVALDKANEENDSISAVVENLENESSAKSMKIENLQRDLKSSTDKYESLNKKYTTERKELLKEFIDLKASSLRISSKSIMDKLPKSYSIDDVNCVCESLLEEKERLNKVPINFNEGQAISLIKESRNVIDDEMQQTIDVLRGSN